MIKLASASYDALDYILNDRLEDLHSVVSKLEKRAKKISIPDLDEVPSMEPSEFALRLKSPAGELRKYAMSTKDLTEINLHLLNDNKSWLPDPVVKTAATNLVRAGLDYGVKIPSDLEKYASDAFVHNLVDITNVEKTASYEEVESADPGFYLLDDKYAVNDETDAQKAASYFDQYSRMFSHEEKAQYSKNLEKRASELGVELEGSFTKYASLNHEEFADDVDLKLRQRSDLLKDNFENQDVYSSISKQASEGEVTPDEAFELVKKADKESGLWAYWGKDIDDPSLTIYKQAKTEERYIDGQRVTLKDLRSLDEGFLTEVMGSDSIKQIKSDEGLDVLETLPSPIKAEILNELS